MHTNDMPIEIMGLPIVAIIMHAIYSRRSPRKKIGDRRSILYHAFNEVTVD